MAFAIAAAVGTLGFSAIALPPNGAGPVGLSTNTVFNGGTSAMHGNFDSPKVNVAIFPSTIGFSSINAKPKPVTTPPSICPVKVR